MENLLEVEKGEVIEKKLNLQEATLAAIKLIVESTDRQVSYDVFNEVEKKTVFGKGSVAKTHLRITIADAMVDTTPKRI